MVPVMTTDNAPMLTMLEVAALFRISRSSVYRLKKEQEWPHHRFGHEVRFSMEDIEAIRAMNRKAPLRDPSEAPRIGTGVRRSPRIGTRANRSLG